MATIVSAWVDGVHCRTKMDILAELGLVNGFSQRSGKIDRLNFLLSCGGGELDGHVITLHAPKKLLGSGHIRFTRGGGPLLSGHVTTEFPSWEE